MINNSSSEVLHILGGGWEGHRVGWVVAKA